MVASKYTNRQALPGVTEQKGSQTTLGLNHMVHQVNLKHAVRSKVKRYGVSYHTQTRVQAGGRNHTTGILGSAFPMDAIVVRTRVRDGQEVKVPGVRGAHLLYQSSSVRP